MKKKILKTADLVATQFSDGISEGTTVGSEKSLRWHKGKKGKICHSKISAYCCV